MAREPRYRDPCGCVSTDAQWLVLCATHSAEWRELHERARKDRERDITPLSRGAKQ